PPSHATIVRLSLHPSRHGRRRRRAGPLQLVISPHRPTIAVLIPCYNLGQYLEEALDSVLAQTFQDFEICVVNDGSTDAYTNDLISRLNRPKTKVVVVANGGLAAARNRGIQETSGRYLCAL